MPPAAVTPLRPGLREDAWPCPRWRSLLCPWAGVRSLHLHLPDHRVRCVLSAERPSFFSCTSPSLALAPIIYPRKTAFYCNSTFSFGPALWWSAATRALRRVCCSCLSIDRSRRSRRRRAASRGLTASLTHHWSHRKKDKANLSEPVGVGVV